jgi:hypothetical protein
VAAKKPVDGNHILYHYLQKQLQKSDIWLFQMLVARLVAALGVWFPPSLYARLPVILPFVVRDPDCRPRGKQRVDQWGAPNAEGYFRDDNSLVKEIPRSLAINCPRNSLYHGRKLGNGFVASHVWRTIVELSGDRRPSAQDAWTNTFVPNLVWLPAQVAKLTDREGSFTQEYIQAVAHKLYHDIDVSEDLRPIVEKCWSKLPRPVGIPDEGLPNRDELGFFEDSPKFVRHRTERIRLVRDALNAARNGQAPCGKVVSTRYTAGLEARQWESVNTLHRSLTGYLDALDRSGL